MLTSLLLAWVAQAAAAAAAAPQAASLSAAPRRLNDAASPDPNPSSDAPLSYDAMNYGYEPVNFSFAAREAGPPSPPDTPPQPPRSPPSTPPPLPPPSPPCPPMQPGGGYDTKLLCPPNALYVNLNHAEMLAAGAVKAGPCWDLSAAPFFHTADNLAGLFRGRAPPDAATFEMAGATDLSYTFADGQFNQNVMLMGLGNAVSTDYMFLGATPFNSPLSLEGLGSTGKWTNAVGMLQSATSFNQPLGWDTSSVTKMSRLLQGAWAFNQPLHWDTSAVTDMSHMFNGLWDTSLVPSGIDQGPAAFRVQVLGNNGAATSGLGGTGGGGATQPGTMASDSNYGGPGGEGYNTTISGSAEVYGSGSGGGGRYGGGGLGGTNAGNGFGPPTAATDNRGGGGGGATGGSNRLIYLGATGGSGIVVIRYDTADSTHMAGTGGSTFDVGTMRSHQFTSSGGPAFTITRAGRCDLSVVGGGGGGGASLDLNPGGGGGGGIYVHMDVYVYTKGYMQISVGLGREG